MNYAIVIPTLNPDEKMTDFVDVLVQAGFRNIILVNDGSSEETVRYFDEAARHPEVTVLTHEVNRGKGAGLKTAFRYLASRLGEIDAAVTADADGQHTVDSITRCTNAFEQHPGNVIFGGREFSDKNIPFRSRFGNKVSSVVYRFSCGIRLNDTQTGLRVIPAEYFEKFSTLKGDRYEYETQMIIAVKELQIPYQEVPIETIYINENESSHFNPLKDSARIYKIVLAYFFKFMASSLFSWVVDIGIYALVMAIFRDVWNPTTCHLIATIASRVISSIVNYILNRKVVFKAVDNVRKTAVRYYILAACQMLISFLLVDLLAGKLLKVTGILDVVIKCVVDGCLFIFSYGIQRKWVFKNKRI
ncbi:MAG: bifunctional glycosyltransferase family 2/GtrA family protein [Parasporobacterium sp.]|nr:bifunctional glycosyltransferase family 2/GtrA family protein [Parasporobacterium sp.]MBQ9031092.1 bifunctional glycosyltransferase family 2/GtrA family protein [Parasporobacterium sp.]